MQDLRDGGIQIACDGRCDTAASVPTQDIAEVVRLALNTDEEPSPVQMSIDEYTTHEAMWVLTRTLLDAGAPNVHMTSIGSRIELCDNELLPLPPAQAMPLDLSVSAVHPAFRYTFPTR